MNIILAILTGFLVRAEGWHYYLPENPTRLQRAIKRIERFFTAITSGLCFGLLCLFVTEPLTALACALAYMFFRVPGFRNGGLRDWMLALLPAGLKAKWITPENGWQHWRNMFIRGLWTTAIGFTLVSLAAHGHIWGILLAAPFSAIYMTIYSGGYAWLPQTILGFDRHVWIEHASGWAFGIAVMGIL